MSPPAPFPTRASVIDIDIQVVAQNMDFWEHCLIRFLIHKRKFRVSRLQYIINTSWQLMGRVEVVGRVGRRYVLYFEHLDVLYFIGLPLEYKIPRIARKLGDLIGPVIEVDWALIMHRNLCFMREFGLDLGISLTRANFLNDVRAFINRNDRRSTEVTVINTLNGYDYKSWTQLPMGFEWDPNGVLDANGNMVPPAGDLVASQEDSNPNDNVDVEAQSPNQPQENDPELEAIRARFEPSQLAFISFPIPRVTHMEISTLPVEEGFYPRWVEEQNLRENASPYECTLPEVNSSAVNRFWADRPWSHSTIEEAMNDLAQAASEVGIDSETTEQ
ncbi:uncharacterized protein G2W53_035231 [Senna tora]|uniref:Uncharacterized protein n=1 Tax=Senna tora TaxID=362788 RepID=A0A834W4Q6_9FABA|nr:uncharacterized protein G2W53_035231 [Senna tora]